MHTIFLTLINCWLMVEYIGQCGLTVITDPVTANTKLYLNNTNENYEKSTVIESYILTLK